MREDNYASENFRPVGDIDPGELDLSAFGNHFKVIYNRSPISINQANTMGRLELDVEDITAENKVSGNGFVSGLGKFLVKVMNDEGRRKNIMERGGFHNLPLYASRTTEGLHVLSIPVAFSLKELNEKDYPGMIVGKYSFLGSKGFIEQPYTAEEIYKLQCRIIGQRQIISDESQIIQETRELIIRTDQVYNQYLEYLKSYEFLSKGKKRKDKVAKK